MPNLYARYFAFLTFFFFSFNGLAQTTLNTGDIMILSMAADMSACGLSPKSDEFSFVCFKDIENGTEIDITDNGWEYANAGYWGDSEGTLRMTRTGGTIPKGTVITMQNQLVAGNWLYRTISPDNQWSFTDLNVPGGVVDIDTGGDQLYFMQGGTWNNQGGGANRAIYDGRLIYGANNLGAWTADGTIHGSNLHPDLAPTCAYMQTSFGPIMSPYMDYLEYSGPLTSGSHFEWLERMQWIPNWYQHVGCAEFYSTPPSFSVNATIPIDNDMGIHCQICAAFGACAPYDESMYVNLPPTGTYDVVYTNGIDTFTLYNVFNGWSWQIHVTDVEPIDYWLVSVTQVGGCTVYSDFGPPATIAPLNHDAGLYNELWVCPNYGGWIDLNFFLNGTPEPGGVWSSENFNLNNGLWGGFMGEGLFTYYIPQPHGSHCVPPFDSASVRIHFIDASQSTIDITCDQNGTPNDIFDDQIVFTLNFIGSGFGTEYTISVSDGTITPNHGFSNMPQTFTLSPGSAMGPDLTITVQDVSPFWCAFDFPIPAPGYCSDPCDHDMYATLSGDDDICLKNCPDNPATFEIEVFGGNEPYTMDFSLSAASFPTWNFTGVVLDQYQEIKICVDNVPAPIYNAVTGYLTIPAALGGFDLDFSLLNVYDMYNCTAMLDNPEHSIAVHKLPPISTTTLTLCSDVAKHINLTDYDILISTFLDVTWYDGSPFLGGDLINSPTAANLDNVVQLWAKVADDYCENAIQVPFIILPKPDLDSIPPIAICQGSGVVLQSIVLTDAGNSMATYTFHASLPPDSTNLLDPAFFLPADSTTIYVLASAAICFDTLPIEIHVQDYPDFSLQGTPCDLIAGTYSILFTSSADSIDASAGTVINNPSGQDAITGIPNNLNVTIELLNPSGLCKDTIAITAPNCNCPLINQPVTGQNDFEICLGEPLPVMTVTIDPGQVANWYDVPSGGVPILQNSLTFQPPAPVDAMYYAEALDPLSNCYSIRTAFSFAVHPFALLQSQADPTLCDGETINLNTLTPAVLNGVTGAGNWFDLTTHLPASGSIQPQAGDSWYYLFTANPGNCITTDTIAAIVNPLPAIDLYDIICDDLTLTYELAFTSDADVIVTNNGILVQVAGTDSFSIQSIPYDTDVQLNLQYSATGCAASVLQAAPDCSCPALLQNNSFQSCSDAGTIDLSTFEGPGVNGTWQLVSTPGGANPAILAGTNFQVLNKDPGLYTLRFIRSILLASCIDTAVFQLQLHRSPFADAGTNASVCAPDVIILSGTAGGSNVTFNWQTNGSGIISNPNALNTSYTPTLADISAGTVRFTLTATDQTGFCPPATETINITIDASAYFILNAGTQTYCDTSNILVDLDPLISFGNTGGTWFFPDTVNAPITGSSQINPSTLTAGNYTIFYASTNAVLPCKNDTASVNLIIRKCACPSVAVSAPAKGVCSESDVLDLSTLVLTPEPGTWTIITAPPGIKPAVITGSQFKTNNSDAGNYVLRFSLSNPVNGCPSTSDITLQVIPTPVLSILSVKCADDLQSWQAVISSSSVTISNNQGNLIPLGNNQYRIENITLLTHLQIAASNGNGLCTAALDIPNPDCACTLSISNLPDQVTLCPDETVLLDAHVNDPKGTVTSFWITPNDSLFQNTLQVAQAGTYQFVASDALGCKETHDVEVNFYTEMVPALTWIDINCPGDHNGQIILEGIQGGNAPFFISVNGGNMQPILSFPYIISDLAAGTYQLDVFDGFSCSIDFSVQIKSASAETISLGPDQTILVGDSLYIDPLLSFTPDSFYWTGDNENLLNPDQLNNWTHPETDQLFHLYAIDAKGCLYTDDLKIRVLLTSSIYVPNIFSPDEDGINDIFAPMTDPSITTITYFQVFSRWGELIYSAENFAPNQGNIGWNGTNARGKQMPGVYVYRLEAVNKRGTVFTKYGDVTLVR